MTRRKAALKGVLAGATKKERLKTEKLTLQTYQLRKDAVFEENGGEGIPTVFENLDINDEFFTIEEVEKATSTFREGKA